jgi:hypothetical protein
MKDGRRIRTCNAYRAPLCKLDIECFSSRFGERLCDYVETNKRGQKDGDRKVPCERFSLTFDILVLAYLRTRELSTKQSERSKDIPV